MLKQPLAASALVLAAINLAYGQEKPYTQTAPGTQPPSAASSNFFTQTFVEAFTKGKVNFNARLRYELVNQEGVPAIIKDSHALTVRTRLGFTTAPLYGFQGMIEAENVTAIMPDHNYNAAGSNGQATRPVVADPPTTEINQAWLSYSNWKTTVKGGRQRLVLDNHRFIGDVGWRQNMQTYDAAVLEGKWIENASLTYAYLWDVHRVFGDVGFSPATVGNGDFDSDSHVVNLAYAPSPLVKLSAYTYLLDLMNAAGAANSCATYGGSVSGAYTFDKEKNGRINYRGEFAWQTDYADSTQDYQAEYYNVELSGDYDRFTLGAGYEVLGTDSNDGAGPASVGFRTPLATLHAFNGWADVFLATPAKGLRDLYAFAGVKLPGNVPVRVIYHEYEADSGGADFGREVDVVASRAFGKNWTTLLKYACYNGEDAPSAFDKHVFWAQVEFNF